MSILFSPPSFVELRAVSEMRPAVLNSFDDFDLKRHGALFWCAPPLDLAIAVAAVRWFARDFVRELRKTE
jgi:hypothetical protein